MMQFFCNCWWYFLPSTGISIFYAAGQLDMRILLGEKLAFATAKLAFDKCTERERRFIVWCNPVFEFFVEMGQ